MSDANINIRPETPQDIPQVRIINLKAFAQSEEADIVDKLRESCSNILSLVAEDGGIIVGHILFSPVVIESSGKAINGMGLAPMAVMPDQQKQGIGSLMVRAGLSILRERNCPFVVVLGHPEYYPRFGFEPASKFGIKCQWDGIPDNVFMMIINDQKTLYGISGVARYRVEFDSTI
jgi:putative acetyltransferase